MGLLEEQNLPPGFWITGMLQVPRMAFDYWLLVFKYLFLCVYVWHISVYVQRVGKVLEPLELAFRTTVNHLKWVLGAGAGPLESGTLSNHQPL